METLLVYRVATTVSGNDLFSNRRNSLFVVVKYILRFFLKNKNAIFTYASQKFITADFDGTFTDSESGIEIARCAGREREARVIYHNLISDCERIVDEAKSSNQLIREVENSYRRHLAEGAKLLKGSPSSILSEVQCKPNGNFLKIIERSREKNGLRIASYTDEEIVRSFLEQNKGSIPINHEIVCSKLEAVDGSLTGMFLKIPSKTDGYSGGDVFEDSIGGVKLCDEAHRRGYQVHVVGNGSKARLLEKTLRKIGIDYSYL